MLRRALKTRRLPQCSSAGLSFAKRFAADSRWRETSSNPRSPVKKIPFVKAVLSRFSPPLPFRAGQRVRIGLLRYSDFLSKEFRSSSSSAAAPRRRLSRALAGRVCGAREAGARRSAMPRHTSTWHQRVNLAKDCPEALVHQRRSKLSASKSHGRKIRLGHR